MKRLRMQNYTIDERRQMAETYLIFGTFRNAAKHSEWSKSAIHFSVNFLIKSGDFYDVPALEKLISVNKQERAIRGGMAAARKLKEEKK